VKTPEQRGRAPAGALYVPCVPCLQLLYSARPGVAALTNLPRDDQVLWTNTVRIDEGIQTFHVSHQGRAVVEHPFYRLDVLKRSCPCAIRSQSAPLLSNVPRYVLLPTAYTAFISVAIALSSWSCARVPPHSAYWPSPPLLPPSSSYCIMLGLIPWGLVVEQ
jgi:hypothetical protein